MNLPGLRDLVINTGANVLSSTSRRGGFNGPDSVITGCRRNAAAGALSANSIHLHFHEQRPYHWWIVIIREWQSAETTEAWAAKSVCACACVCVWGLKSRSRRMCPLRFTLLPKTAGLYITTGMSTGRRNGEGTVGQGASFTHSHTHTHSQINT